MSEWNFCPEVIARAQELSIGTRVAIHWVEAEVHDQEGTVVGIGIERYGRVNYSVHIDGDISPTDEFRLDHTGRDACSIRPIDPNTAPTAMQPEGLVERYASRSDELAEGGEYPWWSGLAELLRSQAAHITRLEADVARLSKERDDLAEISANSRGVHIDRNRWKDRAETAEAQNKAMTEALELARERVAHLYGEIPLITRIDATLSSIKDGA